MKPTAKSRFDSAPLLAFGAHPDDIEFGCGGIIARETLGGRAAHFVICSRGESATHGTPAERTAAASVTAVPRRAEVVMLAAPPDCRAKP